MGSLALAAFAGICLMDRAIRLQEAAPARRLPANLGDRLLIGAGMATLLGWLTLALVCPLLAMLWRALSDTPGQGGGLKAATAMLTSEHFRWLLSNSLASALAVTCLVLPIAYGFAYGLQRACVPGRALWRGVALLPLLAPSMLPGIALIYLFGNQGVLRGWLPGNLYGFWGIVLGQAIYCFPHALMVLMSTLALADRRLFDAAASMGASPWRAFLTITWPSSRQGVFAAGCLVFTLCVTDFGVPVVVGGDYQTLALEAYKAVVGQQQFGRGALVGLMLLVPALLSFGVDLWLRRRQRDTMGGRAQAWHPQPSLFRDRAYLLLILLACAALIGVFGMAVYASLARFWPYDLSLSLQHYAFSDLPGGWQAYRNSLALALGTASGGVVLVFLAACLLEKTRATALTRTLRLLLFIPMAVPGLVLGLGYVFFFNLPDNPLHLLYGSLPLMAMCTIAHFLTTAHFSASAAVRQLDSEFEAAALSLKVSLLRHFLRVTLPLCLPTLLDVFRYLFVSAMTTVSAVIFLYSPDSMLAAIAVLNLDDAGNTGGAAAMGSLIQLTSALASLLLAALSRRAVRRSQAWRAATH